MSAENVGPSIAETGEFGLIAELTREIPDHPSVRIGPGDDAAVVSFSNEAVVSTDALVEGVHFRQDWSFAHEVGRKAAAVNLADIEAMGARPTAVVVALSAPSELPARWVRQCSAGLSEEAASAGAVVVGGDLTRGSVITITVTALGDVTGAGPVLRSGARPGQVVALRGRLGWAAAGLVVLSRGFRSPRAVVEAHKVPTVPYGAGAEAAAAGASSMIDISDGLLADLGHIAAASGVKCDVDSGALEIPEQLQAVAAATGIDARSLVLTGGEDHALVATFDAGSVPESWQVIGSVTSAVEEPGVTVDQQAWAGATGYQHFRQ